MGLFGIPARLTKKSNVADISRSVNEQLQQQTLELQADNNATARIMLLFGVTTFVFAPMSVVLTLLNHRPRTIAQPAP